MTGRQFTGEVYDGPPLLKCLMLGLESRRPDQSVSNPGSPTAGSPVSTPSSTTGPSPLFEGGIVTTVHRVLGDRPDRVR